MAWGRLWITDPIGANSCMCETTALILILFGFVHIVNASTASSSSVHLFSSQHTQICGPHTDDVCLMFDKNSISKISKVPCTRCTQVQQWKRFTALSISLLQIKANEFNRKFTYARWFVYYCLLRPLFFVQRLSLFFFAYMSSISKMLFRLFRSYFSICNTWRRMCKHEREETIKILRLSLVLCFWRSTAIKLYDFQ